MRTLLTTPPNHLNAAVVRTGVRVLLPFLPDSSFLARACDGLDPAVVWWLVSLTVGVTVHFKKTLAVTGAMRQHDPRYVDPFLCDNWMDEIWHIWAMTSLSLGWFFLLGLLVSRVELLGVIGVYDLVSYLLLLIASVILAVRSHKRRTLRRAVNSADNTGDLPTVPW